MQTQEFSHFILERSHTKTTVLFLGTPPYKTKQKSLHTMKIHEMPHDRERIVQASSIKSGYNLYTLQALPVALNSLIYVRTNVSPHWVEIVVFLLSSCMQELAISTLICD